MGALQTKDFNRDPLNQGFPYPIHPQQALLEKRKKAIDSQGDGAALMRSRDANIPSASAVPPMGSSVSSFTYNELYRLNGYIGEENTLPVSGNAAKLALFQAQKF